MLPLKCFFPDTKPCPNKQTVFQLRERVPKHNTTIYKTVGGGELK